MPQDHRSRSGVLDELRQRQCAAWEQGDRLLVEALIAHIGARLSDDEMLELLLSEVMLRTERGEDSGIEEYQRRFPELATSLNRLFAMNGAFDAPARGTATSVPDSSPVDQDSSTTLPPRVFDRSETPLPVAHCTSSDDSSVKRPEIYRQISRYRIERVLGKGGFGLVYLAYDDQLERQVAIKVPHAHLVCRPEDVRTYLMEARTVASLDHPHIVPVYDVGGTAEFPFFVVSKYIEGRDLASKLKQTRLSQRQSAELVANVAEALHCAHKQGLVHRDVKPGNILLDNQGKAFVVDFGLALRDGDVSERTRYAGTPSYMSPEQARGEGHRIDGRSDIFSLGVVLYELLVGRRPFRADSDLDVIMKVVNDDPRPPRQSDETISRELERISLKSLSKRASDRYTTAFDLAEDLRHFLGTLPKGTENVELSAVSFAANQALVETPVPTDTPAAALISNFRPIKIVPKGLRSFDAHDSDFFLELLPGPRDRDGLPDSIRFWKTRIEEFDPDNTFSVGLIYGPSGCGKSSLVKAGLLPQLSGNVIPIYVEASAKETEARLLNGLRKRCPGLPANFHLKESLAAIRRGKDISVGKKVLIVLDQFEQWLHAKKEKENTELVEALRECDGGRLQCIVMVRDDFWMAVTRFLTELEIDLVPGRNIAAADLFPVRHAEKVLAAFGRAFGVLPDVGTNTSKEQEQFLEQSVTGLTQDGKVICVRLALFAEMMKGKTWTPVTLREVGGTEGVGSMFLEETFSSQTASPKHRLHQKAARAVLKTLLPESGTDIKGHMRTQADMLDASDYRNRPKEFEDLIRILDSEIRLITPTDPEGTDESSDITSSSGSKYYQLTHDYLVPSLRDWLTRKQKETRRGRAELLLADRTSVWNARPENRHLPSFSEWCNICLLVQKKNWSAPQQKMMLRATRYHAAWSLSAIMFLTIVSLSAFALLRWIETDKSRLLVRQLINANDINVLDLINELKPYRQRVEPMLKEVISQDLSSVPSEEEKENLAKHQVHAASALLKLCNADTIWPLLKHRPDPRVRSSLIHRLGHIGIEPKTIITQLNQEVDVTVRRALLLSLGEFGDEVYPRADREPFVEQLTKIYETESDSGIHSASEWLLRKWGETSRIKAVVEKLRATEPELHAHKANEKKQWYITTQGQTIVVLEGGDFVMGSPERGNIVPQTQRQIRIGRRFAIAAHEVTSEQFARFQKERPEVKTTDSSSIGSPADSPQVGMNWYEAAAYCNWLSEKEGIDKSEWCYEPNSSGVFASGMKAKDNYLRRNGYRLPSEAEWEFACRAGSSTSRYYGAGEALLHQYAWYRSNSQMRSWSVGANKPNDFGLFDMLGNAAEWIHEAPWESREALEASLHEASIQRVSDDAAAKDVIDDEEISGRMSHRQFHVWRGGSFANESPFITSAFRGPKEPYARDGGVGFRPARTYP